MTLIIIKVFNVSDDALKVILLAGSLETVEKSQSKVLDLLEDFKTEESDLVKNTKEENIPLAESLETVEKSQSKVLDLIEDFKTEECDLVKNTKEENECTKTFGTADVAAPEHHKRSLGNVSEYKGHLVGRSQGITMGLGIGSGMIGGIYK